MEQLREYCRETGRTTGSIFVIRSGRPIDRRNVWKEMKKLCEKTEVDPANPGQPSQVKAETSYHFDGWTDEAGNSYRDDPILKAASFAENKDIFG